MPDLLLHDGVCGLCQRLVRFVLARDRRDRFRFAALQSEAAREALHRHGLDPGDLDTVFVVADLGGPGERVLSRSRAVLFVLRALGGGWALARLAEPLPGRWLDAAYDLLARHRHRWFGRSASCPLPEPAVRWKFLDARLSGTPGPPR